MQNELVENDLSGYERSAQTRQNNKKTGKQR